MADHVGDGLAQAPGQHRLGVRVERARPQGQSGVVVEADAGRLEGVPCRDDLDRERRPAVAADRLPDVVERLPADPADVTEFGEHRVTFGRGRQPGQPLGGQLGLQRDHRQRLAGQVVHVPGQPEPFLVRGQLGHRPAGLGQLAHQRHLHPEPHHGQADEQDRQQHDQGVREVEVGDPAEEQVAGPDRAYPEHGRPPPVGLGREHHAGGGGHVDPQRHPVLAVHRAGQRGQQRDRRETVPGQPRLRVRVHQDEHVDDAEGGRDGQAADDPRHPVMMAEQRRDRLDQVDEPDAGEEPAHRAAGARHVSFAEGGRTRAGLAPVRVGAVPDGFGGSCRHRSLTSLQCCHGSAGLTAGGARPSPRWPAGHRPMIGFRRTRRWTAPRRWPGRRRCRARPPGRWPGRPVPRRP